MDRQKIWMILLLCIFIGLVGCSTSEDEMDTDNSERTDGVEQKEQREAKQEITLSAVGDILIHDRVYDDAKVKGGYDFYPMLEAVEPYLNDATVTFANQETMIGGEELGLSSYPAFNSPVEVGDVLKEVGVDIVSVANNHTLDRGEEVIQNALQHWDKLNMLYVGAYQDETDQNSMRTIETDAGISLGFLAYTYGTNGIPIPEGKDYLVNMIDKERITTDIDGMKEAVDVIVVSMHFGDEDVNMPNKEQKELAQFLADEGVDIILGHHSHVLQPAEWVEGQDGHEAFVIYSLGNFFSGQRELDQKMGGILTLTITKTEAASESVIDIHSPEFMPTYNADQNETDYIVLPWSDVDEADLPNEEQVYAELYDHMTQWMPELEFTQ